MGEIRLAFDSALAASDLTVFVAPFQDVAFATTQVLVHVEIACSCWLPTGQAAAVLGRGGYGRRERYQ